MQNKNKWLALINIPIQMGAIIFGFTYLGIWLDNRFKTNNLFTIILSLLSVFIALYNVINQVKNLNNNK
jgi:F0F1-type ATP synthase assembly protein I